MQYYPPYPGRPNADTSLLRLLEFPGYQACVYINRTVHARLQSELSNYVSTYVHGAFPVVLPAPRSRFTWCSATQQRPCFCASGIACSEAVLKTGCTPSALPVTRALLELPAHIRSATHHDDRHVAVHADYLERIRNVKRIAQVRVALAAVLMHPENLCALEADAYFVARRAHCPSCAEEL